MSGTSSSSPRRRPARPARWKRWTPWVILAVVVAGALAAGWSSPSNPSPARRAEAIDTTLRCPSCEGISVAASSASTAVAIRQAVLARVRAGQSNQEIDAYFVSRYGPSIMLRPPGSGVAGLVWILPLLAAVAAGAGLAALFWRRRRVAVATVSADDRALVAEAMARTSSPAAAGAKR